jgi:type II secretory pathway pseudopilin PulG
MRSRIDNSSGFTLIEVIFAAIIILFGLLTMASFLGSLMSKNSNNERKTIATAIAEEKIENLRGDALTVDITNANSGTDTVTTAAGTFTRTWTITEDFVGLADQVSILVDWDGAGNTQITMVTLINN